MNARTLELALRKQRLQFRSAELRRNFGAHAAGLKPLTAVVDTGLEGVDWLRRHPQWVVATTMVFLLAKPRRLYKLGARAWSLGRFVRGLRPFLSFL